MVEQLQVQGINNPQMLSGSIVNRRSKTTRQIWLFKH